MLFVSLLIAKWKAKASLKKFKLSVENLQRDADNIPRIKTKGEIIREKLAMIYPRFRKNFEPNNWYDRIFKKGTKENNIYRMIRNYLLLQLFGFILFTIFALQYSTNPDRTGTYISSGVQSLTALLIIFPSLMKLIVIYVYRCIASKTSTVILLIIVALAFEVPAMNTTRNMASLAESVSCVTGMVGGIARDIKDEAHSKMNQLPDSSMGQLLRSVTESMISMKDLLRKLDDTVTKLTVTIKNHYKAISNITKQCQQSFMSPYRKCVSTFYDAYAYCQYKTPFGPCEHLNNLNVLCETSKFISENVCTFPSSVKSGITEGFLPFIRQGAEPAINLVKDSLAYKVAQVGVDGAKNFKDFGLELNTSDSGSVLGTKLHRKLKQKLKDELKMYSNFLNSISNVIHFIFLPFNLIFPFFTACKFVYKFCHKEDYKNTLITNELVRIDQDRALKGYTRILPLTSVEKETYCNVWRWKMNSLERGKFCYRVTITILAMALPLLFIFIDLTVYEFLWAGYVIIDTIHLDIPDHFEMKVSGNGSIANLMNGVLQVFQPVQKALTEKNEQWRECFKEPNPPDYAIIMLIFALFTACIVLARLQIWMNRGTVVIANAFYSDRIRPRALHLYYKILEHRQNVLASIMQLKNQDIGVEKMQSHDRVVRRSMQSRGLFRVECAKCDKKDMRVADTSNVRACIECRFFYCIECFSFLRKCIGCESEMQIIDGIEMYYEKNEDDINTDSNRIDIVLTKVEKST